MVETLWVFFIFAFLGWCGEVAFAAVVDRRFVNRGFLAGPVCPIYGFGAVLVGLLPPPVSANIPALLICCMLLCSGLEWLTGALLEKLFRQKWWDYSNEPHNLNGYICLRFSILWAVAGAVAVREVLPPLRRALAAIPRPVSWAALGVLGALLLADLAVTAVAIFRLNRDLKNLETLSRRLEAPESQPETLAEAQRLQGKYLEKLEGSRLYRRLGRAFPDLRDPRHNPRLEVLRENVTGLRRWSAQAIKRRDDLARAAYEQTLAEGEERPFAFGLCWAKLFWIFLFGSFVGFVCETLYALAVPPHVLEARVSFVFGPFIAVYGLGAVAITVFLYRMYNQRDVLIFLASMVLGAFFEYLCSFIQQAAFGTVSWEYSDSAFNIGGRTNLMYSVFWGILGLLWIKDVYPVLSRRVQRVPRRVGVPVTWALFAVMLLDTFLTVGALARRTERINEIPASNQAQVFFDVCFPDEYLDFLFPHMQYLGKPELVKDPPAPTEGER